MLSTSFSGGLALSMAASIPGTSLAEQQTAGKAAGPCVFVLFGASGDLTKRKLVPALLNLVKAKLLPEDFAVVGVSVDDLSPDAFRDQVSEFLPSRRNGIDCVAASAAVLRARRLRRSQHFFAP